MKTKYFLCMLATLLLGACSDDEVGGGGGGTTPQPEAGKTAFGFALKDFAKGSVPLSKADGDKLPASVAESTIDSLAIYVFNQHADTPYDSTKTLFVEEFKVGGDQLVASGSNKTATVQLSGTGKKKIYFVANAIGQHDLDRLKLNETTEAQFLEMKTNTLTKAEQLASPLVMTAIDSIEVMEKGALGGTNTGYQVELESTVSNRTIELKRILARFDIENQAETSDLVIESIALNKVHPSALVNKAMNFQATQNKEYTYSADPQLDEMEKFNFTRYPNANNGRATSVFYVYPDMDKGNGSADGESATAANRIYLTLYGKTKKTGANVVYNVYMYKDNADQTKDPIIVKPNNQYLIKINDLDPTKLKATITVQDWLIGDTVNYEMSLGSVALSCVEFPLTEVTTGGSGQLLTLPTARANGNGRAVNVAVEAVSEWELAKGYNAAWIDTTTNIDPANLPVGTLATVLPQTANPYKSDRRGTLVFRNVQRPSIMQTLVVVQKAGTGNVPVAIGTLSAGDAATYTVVNRPTDGTTNSVGFTEKTDTLMLAGGSNPAFLANTAYTGIVIKVDSCSNTAQSIQQEWTVRVDRIDSTWIHVTEQPKLNEHAKSIKFDLLANDTTRTRTGTIRLYDRQDATIYRDLVIIQAGIAATGTIVKETDRTGDGFTDLDAQTGDVPQHYDYTLSVPVGKTTAAPYRIKLTTNGTWSIADPGNTASRNWLNAYALQNSGKRIISGMGDAIIEIGTTLNDSANVRTGFVTINLAGADQVIKVEQAASVPVITLDDRHITGNQIEFPATTTAGGTISESVQFITNDNWTVTAVENDADGNPTATPATWLTFSNAKDATSAAITGGSGSKVLKITAAGQTETGGAGTGAAARNATVTIKCEHPETAGGSDNPVITLDVYQAGIEATIP